MMQEYLPPASAPSPSSKLKTIVGTLIGRQSPYAQVTNDDLPLQVFAVDGVDEVSSKESDVEYVGLKAKLNRIWLKHQVNIAWGLAVCGLLCTAWISPCFKYLGDRGVAATRRASWRSQVLLMLLSIPSILEYRTLTPEQKKLLFTWGTIKQLLVCGVLWLADLTLWSNGLEFTTVPRASIFANSYSLLLVAFYKITKRPVSGLEIIGALIGFTGLSGAVLGTHFFGGESDVQTESNVYIGDLLCFGSACATGAYIVNAGPARKNVPTFLYTLSNTFILLIGLSSLSLATEHTAFDTSVDGLFGWTQPRFFVVVFTLSVVAGVIGFNLNCFSVKYVPALAYSLVALCDPILSGTYAYLIGADDIPGIYTFIGGGVTISGIVLLLYGQDKRSKQEKLLLAQQNTTDKEMIADGASLLPKDSNTSVIISEEEIDNEQEEEEKMIGLNRDDN